MAESVIRIMCPNLRCKSVLAVPQEARGRVVRCKQCGSNIRVPQRADAAAAGTPNDAPSQAPAAPPATAKEGKR